MKSLIIFLFCLVFLGCSQDEAKDVQGKLETSVENRIQEKIDSQLESLSINLKKVYLNNDKLSYQFMGNENGTVKTFITGKELVIPILYESINNELVLSIAILINLETKSKEVFIDNLRIDYKQFKELITNATDWIYKTDQFSSKYLLEKSLEKKIEVKFPQKNEVRVFDSFMIFDGERNLRNLILREKETTEYQTVISFKRNKVIYLVDKIKDEYISGSIAENYNIMISNIDELNEAYLKLDLLLKNKENEGGKL
ncbi:MAG: hypothetical protein ACRCZO_18710 [Cetobacterium sp.]|uniref:hypothetical protein n=1 Tax=Cetobacterium sp. TaxID=2071632 RepID=UPI003F347383